MKVLLPLVLLVLVSCSSAHKLRRAEKLISKAEELGAKWRVDSVQVEIPVPIERVRVDTVERVLPGDSIVIEKDRLKVVIKKLAGDTVKIEAECVADTIKIKVTKTINKEIKADSIIKWWWLVIALALGILIKTFLR